MTNTTQSANKEKDMTDKDLIAKRAVVNFIENKEFPIQLNIQQMTKDSDREWMREKHTVEMATIYCLLREIYKKGDNSLDTKLTLRLSLFVVNEYERVRGYKQSFSELKMDYKNNTIELPNAIELIDEYYSSL